MGHELALLIRFIVIGGCVFAGYLGIRTGNKLLRLIITVVYACALVYYVVASRVITSAVYYATHPVLLASIGDLVKNPSFWEWGAKKVFASSNYGGRYGFIMNIMLFIPLGYIIPAWSKWLHSIIITTFLGFCLSYFIEHFQRLTGLGVYDVDDMLANTMGAFFGAVAIMPSLWLKSIQERRARKARQAAERQARGEAEAARLDRVSRTLRGEKVDTHARLTRKDYRRLQEGKDKE